MPVGVAAGTYLDWVDAVAGQVPGLEQGVWGDEQFGCVVERHPQRAVVADLDGLDGFHEQVEDRCQARAGAGVEFVPLAGGIAQQERCFDNQFGVDAVALVRVAADQGESDLVVERGTPDLTVDQCRRNVHRTSRFPPEGSP